MHLAVIVNSKDELHILKEACRLTSLYPTKSVTTFPGYVRWFNNGKDCTWGTLQYQKNEGSKIDRQGTITENLGHNLVPCVWLNLNQFIEMVGVS